MFPKNKLDINGAYENGISIFDHIKTTIMIQKQHIRIVLNRFSPTNSKKTIIEAIFNGKQV